MAVSRWLESAAWAVWEGRAAAEEVTGGRHSAVKRACAFGDLSLKDLALLLSLPADIKLDEELAMAGFRCRELQFGRRVGLFAPLYYSNVCVNDCLYCGFRSSLGATGRRVLNQGEIAAEAKALLAQGHRRLLLIAGEDPTPRGLALAEEAVEAVRAAGEAVRAAVTPGEWSSDNAGVFLAAELAPASAREFARLAARGVSAYVLFQETYDAELYPGIHPSGPKSDFANRLEAPERAAAGGISRLGLGALYGLGDPVFDTVALVAHARHLEMLFGRPVASVSAPRLEPAEGAPFSQSPSHPVSDALWLRILALLRLALPLSDLIVSTREPLLVRRESLRCGVTVFSAGSRTDPGGYGLADDSRAQFLVGDDRPLSEVSADLRAMGFEPFPEAIGEV
jgi:2-iminoacetate synthase